MIPFRLKSTNSNPANESPSIGLERGAFRMRAPHLRRPAETPTKRPQSRLVTTQNRKTEHLYTSPRLAMLVVLLTVSCLSCFGTAYYLFVTRWEASAFTPPNVANQQSQVVPVKFQPQTQTMVGGEPHEKYLAYLPHSGFHNQRIAFENALVLSRILNRTLLMPPVRLGHKPIRYVNFDALHQFLVLSTKDGLYHCSRVPSYTPMPLECLDYFDYTHVTWDWLVNLTDIKDHQRLLQRWNMTSAWINEYLKIPEAEILTIKDTSPYQYRFLDTVSDMSPSSHKFSESIYIPHLATSSSRLIHIGTLFGSSRLRLKNLTNVHIRGSIRQSMSYSNTILIRIANSIAMVMGNPYLGIHVRLGDGEFQTNGEDNIRLIWWKLLHQVLEYTVEETLDFERVFRVSNLGSKMTAPYMKMDPKSSVSNLTLDHALKIGSSLPNLRCRSRLHRRRHFLRLNIPLFISTDVQEPRVNPLLEIFHKTFPCIFYLTDFTAETAPLEQLRNADDGVMLSSFLTPFLDAMVVAHAWKVVGTEGSTFSRFVEDVLWRTYHGRPIVQRG